MSRHRIVRSMNYSDEYDGYDDVYSRSIDEESCISPSDAKQWIFDRTLGQQSISSFIKNNLDIEEEDDDASKEFDKTRRDSDNFQMPQLDDVEQAKLTSCIDEVRNVVGDTVSEQRIVEVSMYHAYNMTEILDEILNDECGKKEKGPHRLEQSSSLSCALTSRTVCGRDAPALVIDDAARFAQVTQVTQLSGERELRRGLDVSSPQLQSSPKTSGRNTPSEVHEGSPRSGAAVFANRVTKEQLQRNAQQLYNRERADQKSTIHMIVIGHVDAGKSTLMGHLLFDTGNVSQRVMHKYEQDSKKMGKQSFMYAWVLDETGEERARGITMDVGHSRIETESKIVNLLDAPGHKDFIPNMISGATQADVALLVVDATRGEFETGFEQGGQTREHALLVRSLGVNQMGVVINKLDTVNWSKERFDEIVQKLRNFLKQAGFKEADISYIPCSGLTGENLTKPANECALKSWYNGLHLLAVIDSFKVPERSVDRPFRMSVSDVFKGTGAGFCISGRIEVGVLCVNDKVLAGPSRELALVKSIQIDDVQQASAFAGDQVSVVLSGVDVSVITVGCIICDPQTPIPVATRFKARILVFNLKVPITIGFPVLLHHQSLIEPAVICKLYAQIHKGTGDVVKKKPRCLGNNSCAIVEIEIARPICIECYADCKELGRFMLRVSGVTIAAGMVTKIR